MKQVISWFKSKEEATNAKQELVNAGFRIDESIGDNGISLSTNIFRFTKGEIHKWIYGGIGGFVIGLIFGFLFIENIIVVPRLAPLFSADSSAIVFVSGLVGAAIVGSITSIISILIEGTAKGKIKTKARITKKKGKEDEKKQEKQQKQKQEIITTEEEWAIVLPNVEPHNIRNIKEILQKNKVNRIEESTSI